MSPGRQIVLGFLLVGIAAVATSSMLVQRISAAVDEIQDLHSPALESILLVRGAAADGVQASFAYLVSGEPEEKQKSLRMFGDARESLQSFAQVARITEPGEEHERSILDSIRSSQADFEDQAVELYRSFEQTGAVDAEAVRRYRAVVARFFVAMDELVALEHEELQEGNDLALKTVKRARVSLWVVAGTVLLFALVAGSVLRRAVRDAERAQAEQRELRNRFVERSIVVQDNERQRIARELHDETGQALSALSVGLRDLSESRDLSSARQTAGRLQRTAEGLVHEVSRLVQGLHPHLIEDHGLIPAIEQMAAEFDAVHDLTVDVDVVGVDETLQLSREEALAVYRVVQEALSNVARHAEAQHVGVYIGREKNRLRVMVEDDGSGFDPRATRGVGIGLQSMRERAASLGAQFILESNPRVGTTVGVVLPLS